MNKIVIGDKYTRLVEGLTSLSLKYNEAIVEEDFLTKTAHDIQEEITFLKEYPIFDPSCRTEFREKNRIANLEEEYDRIKWQMEQLEVEKEAIRNCYLEQLDLVSIVKGKLPNYGYTEEDIEEMSSVKRIKK